MEMENSDYDNIVSIKKHKITFLGGLAISACTIGALWMIPFSFFLIFSPNLTDFFVMLLMFSIFYLPGILLILFGIKTFKNRTEMNISNLITCFSFAALYLLIFLFADFIEYFAGEDSKATNMILGSMLLAYIFQEYFKRFIFRKSELTYKPINDKSLKACSAVYSVMICSILLNFWPSIDIDYSNINFLDPYSITLFAFSPVGLFFMWVIFYFIISQIAISLKDRAILKPQKIKEDNSP
jgi:hypothetical protein